MNSSSELFCIRNSKYLLKLKIVEIYLKNSLLKYLELKPFNVKQFYTYLH